MCINGNNTTIRRQTISTIRKVWYSVLIALLISYNFQSGAMNVSNALIFNITVL